MGTITPQELKQRLASKEKLTIIDVREPWENEEFNIGGINIPLSTIEARLPELEPHRSFELIVYCKSGNRSTTAQRVLERLGFENVRCLDGGLSNW